jgi:hypothetical protein
MKQFIAWVILAITTLAGHSLPADAQYYPGYPNPYYPPAGYGGYGPGNVLNGAASFNQSTGDLAVSFEQARIINEQAKQAKLDTRKKAFDQMLYEKANTPTYTETLTKDKLQFLNRILNFPTKSEVVNGTTLNTLLPFLQSMTIYGAQGPPVNIGSTIVEGLNISTSGNLSIGMLRNGGQVDWPVGLQGPQQKKLDKLLPAAVQATAAGKLNNSIMTPIYAEMKAMRESLRTRMKNDEIDGSEYMQGIDFFNSLENNVKALQKPDARKQLNGSFSPSARNVQELVEFMTDNGLKFAPATPGNENAYQATHDAFVRYSRIVQSSAGVQTSSLSGSKMKR